MVANLEAPRHPLFPAPPPKRPWWSALLPNKGVTATCHAKINLFLHVNSQRPDGYHSLQSWVVFADMGDSIQVRASKQYHLVTGGPFANALPSMTENIVTKAAYALSEHHHHAPNFFVELTKNLPIAAGLGGGSANAAAMLRAMQQFWGFAWAEDDAEWLARTIGADVPVCLAGQSCVMTGMGEELYAAPPVPANCHVVLVHPGVGVSTAQIYRTLVPPYTPALEMPIVPPGSVSDVFELVKFLQTTRNDLMHPAMGIEPAILQVYRTLTQQTGCLLARMSGSGSTCFGIFADGETARMAATAIRRKEPKWWVRQAQLLPG